MRISAKTEYACIAMLELTVAYGAGEPVRIRNIAEAHGIPSRFLVQILLQLKGAGYVMSTRGASGGYQLAKPPDEVTLGEVMQVIDGQDEVIRSSTSGDSASARVLVAAWNEVAETEREMLHALTFSELASRQRKTAENMYYI
ncbi:MAG: Rrf2 family transcriptional regulator [Planctomycetales bacterium]|nr:Rrf2 family transcriptional regulator [Planctomycetales bacterium]MBN8624027.1 Rrf2 family transcriptional regulator [Planctomycetota bacterium]